MQYTKEMKRPTLAKSRKKRLLVFTLKFELRNTKSKSYETPTVSKAPTPAKLELARLPEGAFFIHPMFNSRY